MTEEVFFMMNNIPRKSKGIILMLLSAFFFALMQVMVKLSGGRIPLMEQVFFRNLISMFIMLFLILKNHESLFGPRKYQPWLFGRSFFGCLGVICMFYAVNHANQADVSIVTKMSPFLVTIFAAIFLKEKISKIQFPAMAVALIGCIIVANPTFNSNLFPLFIAFLNAITSAIAYTLLSYFRDKVNGKTVIMHFSTFSVAVAFLLMLGDFVMPTAYEWLLLLLIGVFAALGQICLTYSYRMAPAAEVSVYNYFGIIFSMILGYVMLDQSLGMNSIIGGVLVIIASLMVYFYNRRREA